MSRNTPSIVVLIYLFLPLNIISSTTNAPTIFDNFTIQYENFSILTCMAPETINVSLFDCLPSPNYIQVNDSDCLSAVTVDFDQTLCQVTSYAVTYTSVTQSTPLQTTANTDTTISINNAAVTTQLTTTIASTIINLSSITAISSVSTTATSIYTDASTTGNLPTDNGSIDSSTAATYTSTSTTTTSSTATTYTSTSTTTTSTTTTTTVTRNKYECADSSYIGTYCNISSDSCTVSQPCQNEGICAPNNTLSYGYTCECQEGFEGQDCEYDRRVCTETTCWHNGTCVAMNSSVLTTDGAKFLCECILGYEGVYCETRTNFCQGVKCQNDGICQIVEAAWQCLCLDTSFYYGDYCQYKTLKLKIKELLSKSFASIAIGAIVTTCTFVVIMDVLKYFFHIDPVGSERDNYRKRREARRRARQKPKKEQQNVALRFQYVS